MRILIADTTIGSDLIGGAQTFVPKFLGGLVSHGNDVGLISNGSPNPKVADAISQTGAQVWSDVWKTWELTDDISARVARFVESHEPDVYVVSVSPDLGWSVLPHLDPSIATMMIAHSNSAGFYDPLAYYKGFITRSVGVSEEICAQFRTYAGVPADRIACIPYGVEVSEGPPEATADVGPIRLCYVGRLEEADKRAMDVALIALALSSAGVDFHLDIIGHGRLYDAIAGSLEQLIAGGSVEMHGWVPEESVINMLREQDVFLLTSSSEGFPIALVQGMANGCAAVVTDIPSGTQQLVKPGANGFVVPIGDIEGFVVRIKSLADDRRQLLAMREAAWRVGREYGLDRMTDSYEACFRTAILAAIENPRQPDPALPLMPSCRSKYPLWARRLKARALSLVR